MPKKIEIPRFGLELYFGLMGSGKSFVATKRAIDVVRQMRRPVYTNLPLKWLVIRTYLKNRGGPELANLLHPLTERHWRAFLARQNARAKFRTRYEKPRADGIPIFSPSDVTVLRDHAESTGKSFDAVSVAAQQQAYPRQIELLWIARAGPDVTGGDGANWIPPGAVIVIDEVQHWHPMSNQQNETPDLLAYITMLRHHQHWVWMLTQDYTRVNNNIRNLYHFIWTVWNRAEDRVVWGLRAGHLGLRAFAYKKQTREQFEGRSLESQKPSDFFTIFPWTPRNRVIFRFYRSFTNAGGEGMLKAGLEAARRADGVGGVEVFGKKKRKRFRVFWSVLRWIRRVVIACVFLGLGGVLGASVVGFGSSEVPGVDASTQEAAPLVWPRWQGLMSDSVVLDGRRVRVGEVIANGAQVMYYDRSRRSLVLGVGGDFWLWRFSEPRPIRVGAYEDVRRAVAGLDGYTAGLDTSSRESRPNP